MRYLCTSFCRQCIDRQIANTEEIMGVISNPHNHAEERRYLLEQLSERQRLKEESERVGLAPIEDSEDNINRLIVEEVQRLPRDSVIINGKNIYAHLEELLEVKHLKYLTANGHRRQAAGEEG